MKRTLLFLVVLLCTATSFSQALQRSPVGERVQLMKDRGLNFKPVQLFEQLPLTKSRDQIISQEVTNGVLLSPMAAQLEELITNQNKSISLNLPTSTEEDLNLELYQVNVTTPDFQVVTASQGPIPIDLQMAHFRGIIEGEPHSLVAISIFQNEVAGVISGEEGTWVIGKLTDGNKNNEHILYREADLVDDLDFTCHTVDDGVGYTREELTPSEGRSIGDCTNIYVEVGNDIFNSKGGVTGTVNYITGLFNEVAVIYNDLDGSAGGNSTGIEIGLSEIYIWDIADPYSGTSSSGNLGTFQSQTGQFNGDLGIFLNYDISGGIAAGFNGICNGNTDESLCVAGIDASYNTVPTYSWSVYVTAHELGHLFGSRHTHACVWNGNNTAIDGCYRTEGNCRKGSIPSDGGTIMSYCHTKSVGINFTKSFGDQPGTVIYNNIANASCLGTSCANTNVVTVGNDPCSNGVQDPGEEGIDCGGDCPNSCGGGSCDAPTTVNTTGITNRNATMNWSSTAGANSYEVDIREVGASSWQTFSSSSTSASLQGFRKNRTYEWQVRSICTGAVSDNSSICSFTAGGASTQACGTNLITGVLRESFSLFPNPAKDHLQINLNLSEAGPIQVQLIDMMGRSIKALRLPSGVITETIDISRIKSGIYLIRVDAGDESFTEKVIIQ